MKLSELEIENFILQQNINLDTILNGLISGTIDLEESVKLIK